MAPLPSLCVEPSLNRIRSGDVRHESIDLAPDLATCGLTVGEGAPPSTPTGAVATSRRRTVQPPRFNADHISPPLPAIAANPPPPHPYAGPAPKWSLDWRHFRRPSPQHPKHASSRRAAPSTRDQNGEREALPLRSRRATSHGVDPASGSYGDTNGHDSTWLEFAAYHIFSRGSSRPIGVQFRL
ncbi:hypothetical protein ZWY2020_040716 [Hordeum vulgare]|nr:hypothetical protein ZWY2020_040716 [Hordeum vulgare]